MGRSRFESSICSHEPNDRGPLSPDRPGSAPTAVGGLRGGQPAIPGSGPASTFGATLASSMPSRLSSALIVARVSHGSGATSSQLERRARRLETNDSHSLFWPPALGVLCYSQVASSCKSYDGTVATVAPGGWLVLLALERSPGSRAPRCGGDHSGLDTSRRHLERGLGDVARKRGQPHTLTDLYGMRTVTGP
jgi:hypothetical protein